MHVPASHTRASRSRPESCGCIHPYRRGTINHLYADMRKAEEKILELIAKMKAPEPKNTKETLARFAAELWKLARKARIEGV